MPHTLRYEEMPGHHLNGSQNGKIAYALSLEHLNQTAAIPAVTVALPYPSRDHPRTVSRRE
jgi:hypothetical protein